MKPFRSVSLDAHQNPRFTRFPPCLDSLIDIGHPLVAHSSVLIITGCTLLCFEFQAIRLKHFCKWLALRTPSKTTDWFSLLFYWGCACAAPPDAWMRPRDRCERHELFLLVVCVCGREHGRAWLRVRAHIVRAYI